jgi:hypothetical protein
MQPIASLAGHPPERTNVAAPASPANTPAAERGSRGLGLATLAAAAALVVAVTVLQGMWTERWHARDVSAALTRDAEILERVFPERFGDWEVERELESNPKELQVAGAVGHISRLYRNVRTKARVSAFVVCATPYHASAHTPDRCYPAAGFEIAEQEHRQTVPLADGRKAETLTSTFRKQGQTLRVFWTYGVDGQWVAPQIARIELDKFDAVYKFYAIIDETRAKALAARECAEFLGTLLPVLDQAVAAARKAPQPEATEAAPETAPEQAAAIPAPARG